MENYIDEDPDILSLDESERSKKDDCIEYLTHLPQNAYDLLIEGVNIRRNAEKKFQEMEEELEQAAEEEIGEMIKVFEEEKKSKDKK